MLIFEIVTWILLGYFSIVVINKIITDLKKDESVFIIDYRIIASMLILLYLSFLSGLIFLIYYFILN